MASRPYKTCFYLKEAQDISAYLNEALESNDISILLTVLKNIAEVSDTMPMTATQFNCENIQKMLDEKGGINLSNLSTFLHN
jgi:DNA-binding phage protein